MCAEKNPNGHFLHSRLDANQFAKFKVFYSIFSHFIKRNAKLAKSATRLQAVAKVY